MNVSFVTMFALVMGIIEPIAAQNDIWTSWDNSKSAVPSNLQQNIANIVAGQIPKESGRDRWEERQEAARRNQLKTDILRNSSSIIGYWNDDECKNVILYDDELLEILKNELSSNKQILDYLVMDEDIRKIILSDDFLLQRVKDRIWDNKDRILYYAKNECLNKLIMSDSKLRHLYVKYDIKAHPDRLEAYTKRSEFKELLSEDPEMKKIVSGVIADRLIAEKEAMEKKRIAEQEEAERRRRAWEAEQRRLNEEFARAQIQLEQNKQERQRDVELSQQIATPICPRDDRGKNKVGGVIVEQIEYDELFEDPAITKAKRNSIVYATQDRLEKAFEDASLMAKIELKKKQKEWQGKVVAIPIGKADALMNNTLEMAYPGSELWKKVKVSQAVRHDEENLITNVVKCVAEESVEAVSSGDFKRFNECITQAKDAFLDQMGEHIADLTHTQNFRKIYKWFTKKEKNDEDY